jgi:hypothetical protein
MAGISYGDGGTTRTISKVYYGDGGTVRTIQKVFYGDGGTTRLVYQAYIPMSGSASNVVGSTTSGNVNQFIGAGSISVSNGLPPYTYLTSFVSGTTFGLSAQTTNAPQFVRSGNPGPGTVVGNYQCVVTDATLATITFPFTVTDNRV